MNTVTDLYKAKGVNVPNLCMIVMNHLEFVVGKTESQIFASDPGIVSVWENVPPLQIVAMNRYFNNLLMRFRAKKNIPVHDTAYMLIKDGSVDDWYSSFVMNVAKFLKINNVFGVVYGQEETDEQD